MTELHRIISESPRNNTWADYHREMTEKYANFVRFEDKREAYYTYASFVEILAVETDGYFEVLNCDWTPDVWDVEPYMWRVFPERDVITEIFAGPSTTSANFDVGINLAGYRRNGEWAMKSAMYWGGVRYYRNRIDDYISANLGGARCTYSSGNWRLGTSASTVEIDSAPSDLLLRIARKLNIRKWNGFYDEEVAYLAEVGGFRRAEI